MGKVFLIRAIYIYERSINNFNCIYNFNTFLWKKSIVQEKYIFHRCVDLKTNINNSEKFEKERYTQQVQKFTIPLIEILDLNRCCVSHPGFN